MLICNFTYRNIAFWQFGICVIDGIDSDLIILYVELKINNVEII
jgi:hypothetical protein